MSTSTSAATSTSPATQVARTLSLPPAGVAAVIELLDAGNTVPFVARYRKEATGGLDEVQIRDIQDQASRLAELESRRQTVLSAIEEQGKLTDQLRKQIMGCETRAELEDLYLPYKRKRRTRAAKAREKGLEPLATEILRQPRVGPGPDQLARAYVNAEVADVDEALGGARDIIAELLAENSNARAQVRESYRRHGRLEVSVSRKADKNDEKTAVYEDYFEHSERLASIASHRFLAIRRGEREDVLRIKIEVDLERLMHHLLAIMGYDRRSPLADALEEAIREGYRRLLAPSITNEVLSEQKEKADETAIEVFANNLRDLLLAAPLGASAVIGIDPGLRTGCKCAVVDSTGRFLEHTTIYPHASGGGGKDKAAAVLRRLLEKHRPTAVAVGNGTAGRETESFARGVVKEAGLSETFVVMVSESGASIYSASDVARAEFPDLDLTVRGAISIARRLQDPLAELVKVDPKSIGVGQYQHDVDQTRLRQKLDEVVESCVNQVGVELNTASAELLARVAGLGPGLAEKIVAHRHSEGAFETRRQLLKVSGLGPKTFEQAAGFLRIRGSKQPLDASAVHPERYGLVKTMAQDVGCKLSELVGNEALIGKIELRRYVSDEVGEFTLKDIVAELRKPGRDPRKSFEPPAFRDDVHSIDDLREGMVLQGVVTNVTNFGAFVDVGVHRDGLVHISQLADRYVRDPHEVVRTGDRLTVVVLEVDRRRKRISLSARETGK